MLGSKGAFTHRLFSGTAKGAKKIDFRTRAWCKRIPNIDASRAAPNAATPSLCGE